MTHLRYLKSLLRHKFYVFLAGLRVGAPIWRLIIHDWTKFTPAEWGAYARYFYGRAPSLDPLFYDREWREAVARQWREHSLAMFDFAWLHHQRTNKHHWQYWLLIEDSPKGGRWGIQCYDQMKDHWLADNETGSRYYLPGLGLSHEEADSNYRLVAACVRDASRYRPLPMPEKYVREMVADWAGAGRAYTGHWDVRDWYKTNQDKIVLHPTSRSLVEALLRQHFV